MSTYELPIERIDAALLDSLVRDGVEERRRLEYKRALPGGTDDEKKEFLADTSSFANAAGGDLIKKHYAKYIPEQGRDQFEVMKGGGELTGLSGSKSRTER
jgi:hypothetical protein